MDGCGQKKMKEIQLKKSNPEAGRSERGGGGGAGCGKDKQTVTEKAGGARYRGAIGDGVRRRREAMAGKGRKMERVERRG